jgi:hypothetical protein
MTAVQELIKKIKVRIPFFQYSVYQDDFDMALHKYYNQTFNMCLIHNEALNEDGLCNICLENSNK